MNELTNNKIISNSSRFQEYFNEVVSGHYVSHSHGNYNQRLNLITLSLLQWSVASILNDQKTHSMTFLILSAQNEHQWQFICLPRYVLSGVSMSISSTQWIGSLGTQF